MAINFPDSPNNGDTYVIGETVWQYDGTVWSIIPFGPADDGVIDGGTPTSVYRVEANNGGPTASFLGADSFDGGSLA